MAFDQFKSPRVPSAPREYEFPYFNQLARALDSFFTNFDSRAGINVDSMSINRLVTPFTALTVANGANNNLVIPATTFFIISAPTSTFSITGILTANAIYNTAPTLVYSALDGQQVVLYNSTANAMTIANQSASSDAPNRIITNTGADIVTTGSGVVTLIYSKADARWVVISAQL